MSVAEVVGFDPTKDKSYAATRLGRSVVDFLAWMELGGTADRTLDQYERDLSRLCKLFPQKELAEITDGDLALLAKRFRPGERRVRVAALRSFFRWAKQTRRISDNPTDYLPSIKQRPQRVIDVFTEPEIDALLALEIIDAVPLAILLDAGLRKAEARALRFQHCSPESGQVVVLNGKGGRDRIIPMSARLRMLLADLALQEGLQRGDHIFYATRGNRYGCKQTILRDRQIGEGTFARWWRACLTRAGVRYRTPHTARHTFSTRWRQRGLAIDELQILLGHSSIRTTSDLYVHTKVADVAEHMRLIEARET